jgi:hypothetical protein
VVSVGKAVARQFSHGHILALADTYQNHRCGGEDVVAAVGTSLPTVERVRKHLVTEGLQASLNHRLQPPRPNKIEIMGDIAQKLIQLACSVPFEGHCHWTSSLLCEELVA